MLLSLCTFGFSQEPVFQQICSLKYLDLRGQQVTSYAQSFSSC